MDDEENPGKDNGDHFDLHSPLIQPNESDLRIGRSAQDGFRHRMPCERLLNPATTESVLAGTANDPEVEGMIAVTGSVPTGQAVARACAETFSGMVWVNAPLLDNDAGPFGGQKLSGTGRQLGAEGLESFRHTKLAMIDPTASEHDFWWFPYSDEEGYRANS